MKEELTTHAFDTTYLFGWDWLLLPLVIGLLLFVCALGLLVSGATDGAGISLILGIYLTVIGVGALFIVNSLSMSDLDKDLLRSDVSDQLQIEELDLDGSATGWMTGRGPEGEFVKFKLVEQDGVEAEYIVLVEGR